MSISCVFPLLENILEHVSAHLASKVTRRQTSLLFEWIALAPSYLPSSAVLPFLPPLLMLHPSIFLVPFFSPLRLFFSLSWAVAPEESNKHSRIFLFGQDSATTSLARTQLRHRWPDAKTKSVHLRIVRGCKQIHGGTFTQ